MSVRADFWTTAAKKVAESKEMVANEKVATTLTASYDV